MAGKLVQENGFSIVILFLLPDVSVEQVQIPSGEAVRFLRQVRETDARAVAGGTVTGELVVADGCLRLALANGEQRLAVFPQGR